MPDITMCGDHKCPWRESCYRYRAVPNGHRQAYFYGPVRIAGADYCGYFLITLPGMETRKLRSMREIEHPCA